MLQLKCFATGVIHSVGSHQLLFSKSYNWQQLAFSC